MELTSQKAIFFARLPESLELPAPPWPSARRSRRCRPPASQLLLLLPPPPLTRHQASSAPGYGPLLRAFADSSIEVRSPTVMTLLLLLLFCLASSPRHDTCVVTRPRGELERDREFCTASFSFRTHTHTRARAGSLPSLVSL